MSEHHWDPPTSFDGFTIQGLIGRGGMGSVYLAHEESLDRKVAIKFVTLHGSNAAGRFLNEARAIARLQHPNVVAIYRIGQVQGRPYLAYEYLEGEGLDRLRRPVPWAEVLQIGLDLVRGLAAAHARGVLHRDVKPGNVLRTHTGAVKLLDFGLAKLRDGGSSSRSPEQTGSDVSPLEQETLVEGAGASPFEELRPLPEPVSAISETLNVLPRHVPPLPETVTGTLMGTPLYMAPELWQGARATPLTDIYASGLVLYELVAGSLPFAALRGSDLARHVTSEDLPKVLSYAPDMPQGFADIIDACVARDPSRRPATAAGIVEALEAVSVVFSSFRRLSSRSPAARDDVTLVSNSFARATSDMDSFVRSVYDDLFTRSPDLRSLFPEDMSEQREKLAGMLQLAVHSLRAPERLLPILEELGHRHAPYGVQDAHFDTLGQALFSALQQADSGEWDEETRAAWQRAYGAISTAMRRGLTRAGRTGT